MWKSLKLSQGKISANVRPVDVCLIDFFGRQTSFFHLVPLTKCFSWEQAGASLHVVQVNFQQCWAVRL